VVSAGVDDGEGADRSTGERKNARGERDPALSAKAGPCLRAAAQPLVAALVVCRWLFGHG
jgi:hypothetical protein